MRATLLREITPEEIYTYEDEGVVWLKQVIDPDWATQIVQSGAFLAKDPQGSAIDFTNLGPAANAPSTIQGFRARSVWIEPELAWGSSAAQRHGLA